MSRLLIVGQAPGRDWVGREPWIHTRSGRRIAGILGVPAAELLNHVDGDNVLPRPYADRGGFSVGDSRAKLHATAVLSRHPADQPIVAAGQAVAWALGCTCGGWMEWHDCRMRDDSVRCIAAWPHPSGANRLWNDPTFRLSAERWLKLAYFGAWKESGRVR